MSEDFFHWNNIAIKVFGDTRKARDVAMSRGNIEMENIILTNTNELPIISGIRQLPDGTTINVMEQHGLRTMEVYAPPVGGVETVEPRYREREEIVYLPAFEAKAGTSSQSEYMGVVICRGGGFEPPYEFIPKESLPEDEADEPMGDLPDERKWSYPEPLTEYEDIVPVGIATATCPEVTPTTANLSVTGGYEEVHTNICREWDPSTTYVPHWVYYAQAVDYNSFTRTETFSEESQFSYLLPDDPDPGRWDKYTYDNIERGGYAKPGRTLDMDANFSNSRTSTGTNYVHTVVQGDVIVHAMKFVVDGEIMGIPFGHWETDDENVNFDSVEADTRSVAEATPGTYNPSYITQASFLTNGRCLVTDTEAYSIPYDYRSSVMDTSHYGLIYSLMNGPYVTTHTSEADGIEEVEFNPRIDLLYCFDPTPLPANEEVVDDDCTEGPLNVCVDSVVFEVMPAADLPVSPRLQGATPRYFRVGNRSIGLFRVYHNYYYPMDYKYVYAEVNGDKQEMIVTEATHPDGSDAYIWEIQGVTDLDDNPLYNRGVTRLIKETITIKEKLNPYTGAWEEI